MTDSIPQAPQPPLPPRDGDLLARWLLAEPSASRRLHLRQARPVAAAVALGVLAYCAWQWAHQTAAVQRKPLEVVAIVPIPIPPPPPPPPPPEQPQQDQLPPEQQLLEPVHTPVDEPKPAEKNQAADASKESMQMNADAQAGGDAFNIGAGSSHGMGGSGGPARLGNATYGQYLGYALQKLVRENDRTGYLAYQLDVDIWIDREGRVTQARIRHSSGDAEVDDKVASVLRSAVLSQGPSASMTMPVKVRLNSRRPS